MSSLRKNFPFLKKIELIQPSSNFDMEKYDVIFTTEKNLDYIYVNRVLEQKNLDDVRHKLRYTQQNITSKREENNEKELVDLNQLFSIIGNAILVDFKIIPISNKNIFKETVNQVVSYVNSLNPAELANVL